MTLRNAITPIMFLAVTILYFGLAALPAPAHDPSLDSSNSDWLFDQSYYTSKPNSNHRVWQYAQGSTPYHDPYSVYDSSHSNYPFEPEGSDPYPYYFNPYYAPMMYPGFLPGSDWYYGWDVNQYIPYSGDRDY
jgi:hypothetical protein